MDLESFEKLEELPIFPLGTVLFPGAILPLHVFEDRYKQMMRFATENGNLFGLSYRSDALIGRETPPEAGSVGCVAKIQAVMPLEEGRMNIISTGLVRYRIAEIQQLTPFVIARVEPFSDDLEADEDLNELFESMLDRCKKFLAAAQALDESVTTSSDDLPEDPEAFSLIISSALPIDNDSKQSLLEMTSTRSRLTRLRQHVIHALADYTQRIEIQARAKHNGHGKLR
ncbi:MAG TPA: LON peptidase substrate-binding domain-containing protein [Blastocatellia bacterium]|nr:LON peptidase substrate-binding domain-containing protein [Blastocatellia bacterium]